MKSLLKYIEFKQKQTWGKTISSSENCEYAIIHWCVVDHESIWFPIRIHRDNFFNLTRDNHNFISLAFAPLKQLEYKDPRGFGVTHKQYRKPKNTPQNHNLGWPFFQKNCHNAKFGPSLDIQVLQITKGSLCKWTRILAVNMSFCYDGWIIFSIPTIIDNFHENILCFQLLHVPTLS